MSDTDLSAILELPADQKLRLVELIWESLAAAPSELPLSDAHRAAIDEALVDHRQTPDDVLTLDQILAEVRRQR